MCLTILIFLSFFLRFTSTQTSYPSSPCPDNFRYISNSGLISGHLTIPNDLSGSQELTVNMSIAALIANNENIRIQLLSSIQDINSGRSLQYTVAFPVQNILPVLTEIIINGRIICRGPGQELTPGRVVTTMWAKSIIRTTIVPNNFQPTVMVVNTPRPSNGASQPPFGFTFPPSNPGESAPSFTFTLPSFIETDKENIPGNKDTPSFSFTLPSSNEAVDKTPQSQKKPQPVDPKDDSAPFTSPSRIITSSTPPATSTTESGPRKVKCGVIRNSQNLILGGQASEEGEFPWLAAILYTDGSYRFKCNGNLVSDRHVITAGHCLRYYNAPLIADENIVVVFGRNNIKNWPLGVTRGIKKIWVHPNYKQDVPECDIIVIELNQPVEFSSTVSPVCLWDDNVDLKQIVGKEGTVVGWGPHKEGEESSDVAEKIEMPVVSQEQCLRSHKAFRDLTTEKTFCAGRRDGTGPCIGDSGSGFLIRARERWFLRGLAGFSIRDDATRSCDLNNYVIFTDVAKDSKWIKQIINF